MVGAGQDRLHHAPHLVLEACLPAQRVHQPRLPGGARQDMPHRLLRERLPGRRRVLRQQLPHLLLREVAQSQRLGLDVEGAAAEHQPVLGGRVDAVVPHVTHPAQDDAVREGGRTLVVAAAQLPQHRQQGVAHQRVDLVDQQHQRLAVGSGPATQRHAQGATWSGAVHGLATDTLQRVVAQRQTRPERKLGQYGAQAFRHVLAHRLACLDVGVHAAEVALRAVVQQVAQFQQRRGLAGLSRCVQHEVFLVPDQAEHRVEIDPLQRRDVVVVRSHYGPLRVERAHRRHGRIVAEQDVVVIRGSATATGTTRKSSRRTLRGSREVVHGEPGDAVEVARIPGDDRVCSGQRGCTVSIAGSMNGWQ